VAPHLVVLATLLAAAALFTFFDALASARAALRRAGGLAPASFRFLKALPGVSSVVRAEQAKMLRKLADSKADAGREARRTALPPHGTPAEDVLDLALDMADEGDTDWTPGLSQMSGARSARGAQRVPARCARLKNLRSARRGNIFALTR
jgi:hypothetical protein